MSVAEDGNEQEQPGETPRRADRAARHRVPPTASATAKVPVLPAPFNPAKPTFPTGSAIPRQRRGGPTAIATAAIPTVPVTDDEPGFDDFFAADPELDDSAPDDVAPDDALDDDAPGSPPSGFDEPASGFGGLPPGFGELPSGVGGHPDDPATVGTLAGEVRASTAEPLPPPEPSPLLSPSFDAAAEPAGEPVGLSKAFAAPAVEPVGDVTAADPQPVGVAPVVVTADDSPTVADYVAPAFAIVTDDPVDEDGPDYRGSRRRTAAWRRYPVGAVAVAVLILLVTAAVVLQLVRSDGDDPTPTSQAGPQRPNVGGLPELTRDAVSPSSGPSSASPAPSRSKSPAPAAPPASASASASKPASSAPVAPPPPSGQLRGAGSAKCLEYRAGESNRAVIDNCDARGSGRSNQRWVFQADGTVRADGGCLDVTNAGTANRTPVRLFACNGTPAQRWTLRADGTLQNVNSKRCLDVENGGTGAGSPIIIWDCSAASNQKWALQAY